MHDAVSDRTLQSCGVEGGLKVFIGVKMKKMNNLRGEGRTQKDEKIIEEMERAECWNTIYLK